VSANTDYFDGLFHAFRRRKDEDEPSTFRFTLDNELRVSLKGKPSFNLMLGYDVQTDSVEFAYPWIRPVYARLIFGPAGFVFSCNKNYLRFSRIVAEGWDLIDVFRSAIMVSLIKSGMYMAHGAAIKLNDEGILIPSFANTGKTTAAWMLSRRGAKYLTDELAVLDSHGTCFSLPCSSLLTSKLIQSLGLNLTKRQRVSLLFNDLKSRLLSVRFVAGGLRLHPEVFFEVCDDVKIAKAMFVQNGIDEFRKLTIDEATARFMAIRSYELGWDSNPYLIAESFFNPGFDLEDLRRKERAFVASFLSGLKGTYLVSSSSHSHYKVLEEHGEAKLKPPLSVFQS